MWYSVPLISRIKGNSFTFSNYKQDKKPNFYSLCSSATFSYKNSKLFYFSMIINDNKTYPRNWICMALFTHNQRWKISRDKWFTYWWIHFQHVPDNRAVCEGRWMKHVNGSLVVIHARNVPRRRITCLDKAKPTIAGAHAIKNQSANVSFFFFFRPMNSSYEIAARLFVEWKLSGHVIILPSRSLFFSFRARRSSSFCQL